RRQRRQDGRFGWCSWTKDRTTAHPKGRARQPTLPGPCGSSLSARGCLEVLAHPHTQLHRVAVQDVRATEIAVDVGLLGGVAELQLRIERAAEQRDAVVDRQRAGERR